MPNLREEAMRACPVSSTRLPRIAEEALVGVRFDGDNISIASRLVWRDVPGDLVLFDERTETYHALNRVGSFVWRRVARGLSLQAILQDAVAHHAIDEAVARAQISEFLSDTVRLGLLEYHPAPE